MPRSLELAKTFFGNNGSITFGVTLNKTLQRLSSCRSFTSISLG
jgi:hypothetical protein